MEYLYTVHTKLIQDKTHYFVKKLMKLSEFDGLADVVVGYGMHTDFEKACRIAGIDDTECRKQLLLDLEKRNLPAVQAPVEPKKQAQKPRIQVVDSVTRWLADRGVEVLN